MSAGIYIRGVGTISPQDISSGTVLPQTARIIRGNRYFCVEPDYKVYIDPPALRRMSRILKMGISTAVIALRDAKIEKPDAIIVGTGLGCVSDTNDFLDSIIDNNEEFLSPTSFIQSTHNTIASQIAIMLKCVDYNSTYVERGHSFESALIDAMIRVRNGFSEHALVGGIDELTDTLGAVAEGLGVLRQYEGSNLDILSSPGKGVCAGEGSAFFVLSHVDLGARYGRIVSVTTMRDPADSASIVAHIENLLSHNGISPDDIDLVVAGLNGDAENDRAYADFISTALPSAGIAAFKHVCGEYFTSTGFALSLACGIISGGMVPDYAWFGKKRPGKIEKILVCNNFGYAQRSFVLLSRA
jgi:3-oxoacyl-[acyl-carrier-protein] synthase II